MPLAEEVEVEEEVVVVVVAWAMEQGCEKLYGLDVGAEQPLEAMQLPVLPMNLAEEEVKVEQKMVQLAELVVPEQVVVLVA